MRFHVLAAVLIKVQFLRDAMPCRQNVQQPFHMECWNITCNMVFRSSTSPQLLGYLRCIFDKMRCKRISGCV